MINIIIKIIFHFTLLLLTYLPAWVTTVATSTTSQPVNLAHWHLPVSGKHLLILSAATVAGAAAAG